MWPAIGRRTNAAAAPPRVLLAGQPIPDGPEGDQRALEVVRRYARSPVTIELARGSTPEKRSFSRAAFGIEIDKARLFALLRQARDPGSAMRRTLPPGRDVVLPIPV